MLVIERDAVLPSDERKAFSKFEQKMLQMADDAFF